MANPLAAFQGFRYCPDTLEQTKEQIVGQGLVATDASAVKKGGKLRLLNRRRSAPQEVKHRNAWALRKHRAASASHDSAGLVGTVFGVGDVNASGTARSVAKKAHFHSKLPSRDKPILKHLSIQQQYRRCDTATPRLAFKRVPLWTRK